MNPDQKLDERFVALLVTHQQRIFQFLMTLVPSRDDVEDLLQQTCLTLWQNRAKFDPKLGEFSSWACRIAHNHVRNFRRREKTRRTVLSEEVTRTLIFTQAEHTTLIDEWQQALVRCMELLTPHQRKIVRESYSGSSIKDAAPSAGRTANSLYKILRHIRERLRECIQKTVSEGEII